jgi:hypothetical protein
VDPAEWLSPCPHLRMEICKIIKNKNNKKTLRSHLCDARRWTESGNRMFLSYASSSESFRILLLSQCFNFVTIITKNLLCFTTEDSEIESLGLILPRTQWVPGALSPGVKWRGRQADHSPPTITKAKKTWISTSIPPYAFIVQCLLTHRGDFQV